MAKRRYFVILNQRSGTARSLGLTADAVRESFESVGAEAVVATDFSRGFDALVKDGIRSTADAIVAAGGDGTVTAVAEHAMESDKPLLILPLGTANLLARDLGLEMDLKAWFEALDTLTERRIDMASVNGKKFLHLVVIGMMPGIAAGRERVRAHRSVAAFAAFMGFLGRRFARTKRIDVEVTCDKGTIEHQRVSAIAVGNNVFDEGFGHIFSRQVLDDGKLSLYLLRHISVFNAIRLAAGMVFGSWRRNEELSMRDAHTFVVDTRRRKVKVMFDGEPMTLRGPLNFSIEPRALSVLAPPAVAVTPLVETVDDTSSAPPAPAAGALA